MTITPELKRAIASAGDEPVRIEDPETHRAYVVISAEAYGELRELLDEERTREGIARVARRNAASRMQEP